MVEVESMIADLLKRACRGIAILAFVLVMAVYPVAAGDTILSNNSGVENENFYIEGEPSLVINGFDLTPLGLNLPVALDAVSISVNTPAPGSGIDLVVYQDGNGGSPVDATLVYRQPVALARSGINRITIDPPVIITEPVVWVGFYLPVGFHFNADQSGSSVLTYWAWTPGGTFDLNALSSAAVLGPGDGTEPVNISMNGVARITAELRTPEYEETIAGLPLGQQIVDNTPQDTSILRLYPQCDALLYDPEDIAVTASNSFSLECIVADEIDAPTAISQPPNQELDLQRAGQLYKLREQIPESLRKAGAYNTLPEPGDALFSGSASRLGTRGHWRSARHPGKMANSPFCEIWRYRLRRGHGGELHFLLLAAHREFTTQRESGSRLEPRESSSTAMWH